MAGLTTSYMGIELKNPLVVAACSLSGKIEKVEEVAAAGAGAMVIRSLFEEQIMQEMNELDDALSLGADSFAESLSYFPHVEHSGAREHVMWVEKARKATEMPLIASLNAVNPGSWVDYARQLAETGVEGLELNVYAVEADTTKAAEDVEKRLIDTVQAVTEISTVPVAIKLSPFYTSTGNVIARLEKAGAKGAVLFNRFFQPDIDIATAEPKNRMTWSTPREMRVPLRWIGLLAGKVNLDLIGNTGVQGSTELIKYLLAGATAVQTATAVYKSGIEHVATMLSELQAYMNEKGYESVDDFRGLASQQKSTQDPFVYERAQYVQLLVGQRK